MIKLRPTEVLELSRVPGFQFLVLMTLTNTTQKITTMQNTDYEQKIISLLIALLWERYGTKFAS